MAALSDDDVRHIAKLARLRLSDVDVQKFGGEISSILGYIAMLNELETDAVEPTEQVTGLANVLRSDVIRTDGPTTEELLSCSPLPVVHDQIEVFSAHG